MIWSYVENKIGVIKSENILASECWGMSDTLENRAKKYKMKQFIHHNGLSYLAIF